MAIHLLAIGNNYRRTVNALPDCELDAKRVAKLFSPYCASTKTLLSKGRTPTIVATQIFLRKLKAGDLGLLYYSGHGTQTAVDQKVSEAIVCNDMRLIYDFEMRELLSQRAKGSLLASAADCCHSGGLTRNQIEPARSAMRRAVVASRCIKHLATRPQQLADQPNAVFLACLPEESAYSTGDGGAWTNQFLVAMRGDTRSTLVANHRKITRRLPSADYPQHPQFECDSRLRRRTVRSFVGQ